MEGTQIILYLTLFFAIYFELFLLLTFLENKKEMNKKRKKFKFLPSVSVVVPCGNEVETIEGTLDSLLKLDYPKEKLKIIVVDDGSTDGTADKVKKYLSNSQIQLLEKENGGKHTAMNLALKTIDTKLIASLDADSFVDQQALKYLVQHFQNKKVVAVTSAIKTTESKNFGALLQKAEFLTSAILRKTFAHLGSIFITPGPFSIMRTAVVKDLGGGKKAHNTEDLEIGIRIQMKNFIIENEERSIVWTKPLKSFRALYKQRRRGVYGFLKNAWDYKFLFFNKKYGNLGMLILPSYLVGLILTIIMYFIFGYYLFFDFGKGIEKISLVGYKFSWPNGDGFYFNTDTAIFIMIVLILFSVYFLIEAKKITYEEKLFGIEIIFYVLLYALVSPLWLIGAVWQAITKTENIGEDN